MVYLDEPSLLWKFLAILQITHAILGQKCNDTEVFVKIEDLNPSPQDLILLYSSPGNTVTGECYKRCINSVTCGAFVVNYTSSACFRLNSSSLISNESIDVHHRYIDPQVKVFEKSCLKVPLNCSKKYWVLEEILGYEIVGFKKPAITDVQSGIMCGQLCLQETSFDCRSAKYNRETMDCFLSSEDRRTQPDAYRATTNNIEYWENQCVPTNFQGQNCAFEEFFNSSMCCADSGFRGLSELQCRQQCTKEGNFTCRGLTYIDRSKNNNTSVCLLHGEDSISSGPTSMISLPGAKYWERVPCLNLIVSCTGTEISVTLLTTEDFLGRLYVSGYSEKCNQNGGSSIKNITLAIPVERCGVKVARAVAETNRTLLTTVIVVQRNPIIQRRGDRAVQIGCLIDDSFPRNVSLEANISLTGSDSSNLGLGSVLVNSSGSPPVVRARIFKAGNQEASEVQLGQELEFRIDVEPSDSPFEVKAGQLVATSEDGRESYYLLYPNGCPADPAVFPEFQKVSPSSKSLVSYFKAFKFPKSSVVKFSVMVHFCVSPCEPVECENGVYSYGRRKRDTSLKNVSYPAATYEELPLQLEIIVLGPDVLSNALVDQDGNRGHVIVLNPGGNAVMCLNIGGVLGLALAWIVLQFLILAGCYFTFHWQRQKPKDEIKLQSDFSSYDNPRHVHWADEDH